MYIMIIHKMNHNLYMFHFIFRLVPAQDVHFFYTRSHLSALQNCAVLFSTNFYLFFILKECITQFSHWIVSCANFFSKIILQLYINFTHSFVGIELLTFCKNAKKLIYCLRELSLFWSNKYYSLWKQGYIKKYIFNIHLDILVLTFEFFDFFHRGGICLT